MPQLLQRWRSANYGSGRVDKKCSHLERGSVKGICHVQHAAVDVGPAVEAGLLVTIRERRSA